MKIHDIDYSSQTKENIEIAYELGIMIDKKLKESTKDTKRLADKIIGINPVLSKKILNI